MAIGLHDRIKLIPWRKWHWRRLFLVLFAILFTITAGVRWGYRMEEQLGLPMLFLWRGPIQPPEGALIIRVDDPSLESFRQLPEDRTLWPERLRDCEREFGSLDGIRSPLNETDLPRSVYACAIKVLHEMGVRGIQMDVVFPPNSSRETGTRAILRALEMAPNTTLFGMADMAHRDANNRVRVDRNDPRLELKGFGMGSWALTKGDAYNMVFWVRRDDFDMPLQLPMTAALTRLSSETAPALDDAGIECPEPSRQALQRSGHGLSQILACLQARAHHATGLSAQTKQRIDRLVRLAGQDGAFFFNYYGPPSTLPSLSLASLLGVKPWPENIGDIKNAVAFIGHQNLDFPTTNDDLNAVFPHPNGLGMSGVETAATAYLNLWHDDHIRPLPELLRLLVGLSAFTVIALAGARGRPLIGMLAASFLTIGYVLLCILVFKYFKLWLPWMPAILAWPFALLMAATGGYGRASSWLERVAGARFAQEMLSQKPDSEIAGRETEGTILYCDLEGYSRLARELGMAVAADVVRSMVEGMERLINAGSGYTHQITGDGIIACWFKEPNQPADAERACRAAQGAWDVMAQVNAKLMREHGQKMRMRIGLNAGPLLVTGMGREQLHVAIVGETINKGQRIEQLVKKHGIFDGDVAILMDRSVADRLPSTHDFSLEVIGRFQLEKSQEIAEVIQLKR